MDQTRNYSYTEYYAGTANAGVNGPDGPLDHLTRERAQVKSRAAELVAEEATLRDLRQARQLTQERMAVLMGVEQENVSRLVRRADLLLSTLSSYVAAMGGKLRLIAEFPDRQPVTISLADITDAPPARAARRGVAREKVLRSGPAAVI